MLCFHNVVSRGFRIPSRGYFMRDKIAGLDGQTEFVSEFRRRSLFTRSGLVAAPAVMAGVTYI